MKIRKMILAVLMAALVLTLTGCVSSLRPGNIVEKNWDFTETVRDIDISEVSCDVEFLVSGDGGCHVMARDFEKVIRTVEVTGGTLRIESTEFPVRNGFLSFGFFEDKKQKIEVSLPAGEYESLQIATVSGDVEIPKDFSFGGDFSIESVSGDAALEPGKCGDFSYTSVSGDLRLNRTSCGSVRIATTSGDLKLNGVDAGGKLTVETISGEISLKAVRADDTDLGTTSGDVTLDDLDTGSLKVGTVSGDVTGTLASDIRIKADSTSGTIRIPDTLKDSGSSNTVTTVSGDISLDRE